MEIKYPDKDLKNILELEDKDEIRDEIEYPNMYYCEECGYFDFVVFDECPNCFTEFKWPLLNTIDWCDDDNIKHISSLISKYYIDDPSMNTIISTIANAKYFIHIATESLDRFFSGMLAIKNSQGCDVKAVFWRQKDNYLKKFVSDYWEMSEKIRRYDETHQKIYIIDGIVAFKGSANATFNGWTRIGELRETVTNLSEIKKLNETLFANYYNGGKILK